MTKQGVHKTEMLNKVYTSFLNFLYTKKKNEKRKTSLYDLYIK